MEHQHIERLQRRHVDAYADSAVKSSPRTIIDKTLPDTIDRLNKTDSYLAIIDKRALERECLAQGMVNHQLGLSVHTFGSLQEWEDSGDERSRVRAVLFNIGGRSITDQDLVSEISELVSAFDTSAVVLLADDDDLSAVMKALELGVRGYIPTSVGIEICVQAISLAMAGGRFVPASSVMALRKVLGVRGDSYRSIASAFTARQSAVVEGLCRGKANKIIAYELNLCESTVKVHIRNIMKKLGATNRTEVAYKINDMMMNQSQF